MSAIPAAAPDPEKFPGSVTQVNDPKSEAEELRDAEELREHHARMSSSVPIGANGKPMVQVGATVSDKVPTVQFGNVVIMASIQRFVEDTGDQDVIDAARSIIRGAEFVVGRERTLLSYALDPSMKFRNPYDGKDAFAATPAGYDPNKLPDPRKDEAAKEAATAAQTSTTAEG